MSRTFLFLLGSSRGEGNTEILALPQALKEQGGPPWPPSSSPPR
jgi:hypothetical protein